MRHLKANQRVVHYANVLDRASATNASGQLTGEKITVYTDPVEIRVYYDRNTDYDREIRGTAEAETARLIMSPSVSDIKDDTVFWIDADVNSPHDYIVSSISRTLSEMTVILRKVSVRTRYGDF